MVVGVEGILHGAEGKDEFDCLLFTPAFPECSHSILSHDPIIQNSQVKQGQTRAVFGRCLRDTRRGQHGLMTRAVAPESQEIWVLFPALTCRMTVGRSLHLSVPVISMPPFVCLVCLAWKHIRVRTVSLSGGST